MTPCVGIVTRLVADAHGRIVSHRWKVGKPSQPKANRHAEL